MWVIYTYINKDKNGLSAYFLKDWSRILIVTRENPDLKDIPLEILSEPDSFSVQLPPERYWENLKDKPIHTIKLVPWSMYNEDDFENVYSMITMMMMINGKKGEFMEGIGQLRNNYSKIHSYFSSFQYPFLNEIKNMKDCFVYLHNYRFQKKGLLEDIIKTALSPSKMEYYLKLGYTIDDLCQY